MKQNERLENKIQGTPVGGAFSRALNTLATPPAFLTYSLGMQMSTVIHLAAVLKLPKRKWKGGESVEKIYFCQSGS